MSTHVNTPGAEPADVHELKMEELDVVSGGSESIGDAIRAAAQQAFEGRVICYLEGAYHQLMHCFAIR